MNHSDKRKVICDVNCGNAPKKELLRDLQIAFANDELEQWMDWITDDIVWKIIGCKTISGKAGFEKEWKKRDFEMEELRIHNIITHGNTAALNGTFTISNHQTIEQKSVGAVPFKLRQQLVGEVHFCHVYNFAGFGKNAKIKEITSYVIEIS